MVGSYSCFGFIGLVAPVLLGYRAGMVCYDEN